MGGGLACDDETNLLPLPIDVFVCKLRKKLSAATGGDNYIETVWGRGHVLRDPVEDFDETERAA